MCLYTKEEGKEYAFTIWLQSEGLHGLEKEVKTESNYLHRKLQEFGDCSLAPGKSRTVVLILVTY